MARSSTVESLTESGELRVTPHKARQTARRTGLEAAMQRTRSPELEDLDRRVEPFDRHRSQGHDLDQALDQVERLCREQRTPWTRQLFHAGGEMRCLANRGIVHM